MCRSAKHRQLTAKVSPKFAQMHQFMLERANLSLTAPNKSFEEQSAPNLSCLCAGT